ncbi:MAG: hypothetical protein Q4B13_01765 [Lautropia sp.]|nr:hypothetical protein [Lautropia sp.]
MPQMLPGTVLSWIGGGVSDPGESHAVQHVRGQMSAAPKAGVFNPFRKPAKDGSGGKKAPKDENPNPKGDQPMQGGQGTGEAPFSDQIHMFRSGMRVYPVSGPDADP